MNARQPRIFRRRLLVPLFYTFSTPLSITVKANSKRENQVQYAYYQFEKLNFSSESNEFIFKYSMSEFKSHDFILEERHPFSRANRSFRKSVDKLHQLLLQFNLLPTLFQLLPKRFEIGLKMSRVTSHL